MPSPSTFPRRAATSFALLVTLGGALAAAAAERRPVEELIPERANLVLAIRDGAELRQVIRGQSPFLAEPKIKEFLEGIGMSPQAAADKFREETGLVLEDILSACEGPAAVALFLGPDGSLEGDDETGILAIGVKDEPATAELWKKVKEKIAESVKDETVRARDEEFEGAEIWALTTREAAAAGAEKAPEEEVEYFCLYNGHVLMSDDREAMEKAILASKGKEVASLARKAEWKTAMERLGTAADYVIAVDMVPFIANLRKSAASPQLSGAQLTKSLGLDDVRGVYLGGRIAADGTDVRAFFHAPSPRTGLPKMFSPADSALEPDRFAPADALSASASNVNFAELMAEAERLLAELAPQQAAMLPMMLGMIEQQTQVNLKRDLLELLTPPLYSLATESSTPDGPLNQLLYFRSSDAKKALESLKKLVTGGAQGMASIEESEFLGYKIASLEIGLGLEVEDEDVGMPELAFAATDTHLFISISGKAAIEDALRGIGKETRPLTATDDWKRATAALPGQRWNVGFTRLGKQWKSTLDAMANVAEMSGNEGLEKLSSLDPAVLAKYMDLTAYTVHSDAAGILLNVRLLPPATPAANTTPKSDR